MLTFFEQMQLWPDSRLKRAYENGDNTVKKFSIYILEHRTTNPVWGATLYGRHKPFAITLPKEEGSQVSRA